MKPLLRTWRTPLANGETQAVMTEAINALINQPRTWFAYQGQLVLDELIAGGEFRSLDFSNFAQGSFAYSQFYFSAYGAALNNDWITYYASLKVLTGITGNRAERSAPEWNIEHLRLSCARSPMHRELRSD